MFLNTRDVIDKIKEESLNNVFDIVECRVKKEDKYQLYIFTVVLSNQEELKEKWESISSDIGLYFQGDLESEIEIWNIYILFLVLETVDSDIRYLVEQNKFSSRKLVIEEVKRPLTEEGIDKLIYDKLFDLKIKKVGDQSKDAQQLSDLLKEEYKELFSILNLQEKPSELFTKYLEVLK